MNCCLVEHKVHNTVDLRTIADTIRQRLQTDHDKVCKQLLKYQEAEAKYENEKQSFLYVEISNRIEELKRFVDRHAHILHRQLSNSNVTLVKEIKYIKRQLIDNV